MKINSEIRKLLSVLLLSLLASLLALLSGASTSVPETNEGPYMVEKVIDGDTIKVSIEGKLETIRLVGIDTPETVHPQKTVECFGLEASKKAKELLLNKEVYLESDSSQGDSDKYQRLLKYVFLENGTNVNLLMIKEGYAYEYTYDLPYKYQKEFKEAQKLARDTRTGLWGGVCNNQEI
jgi:micrococcal nuclease